VSRKPQATSDKKSQAIDPALVRELAKILDDTGLSEIEVEHGELRLRLARTLTLSPPPTHTHVVHSAPAPMTALPAPAAPPRAAPACLSEERGGSTAWSTAFSSRVSR
jgi:acetyl-CoA carboxylase biotin carboxyl carrier protein